MFDLQHLINNFIDHHLGARGDKKSTLHWYRIRLGQFCRWLDAERPNPQVEDMEDENLLESYVASLYQRGLTLHTVNGHIRILRTFYTYLVNRRHIGYNAARCLHKKKDEDRVPRAIVRQIRTLILDTAFELPSSSPKRDYALLLFLADSGARAGEVCSMTLDKIEMEQLQAVVNGKRGCRTVVFSPAAREALREYIEDERNALLARLVGLGLIAPGSADSRRVWLGSKGPLTYWGVRMLLKRVIRAAKAQAKQTVSSEIEYSPTNAHAFRHAFARDVLQNGGSLTEVRDQLGHKDIQVTAMYSCWAIGERHQQHAAHTEVAKEAEKRMQRRMKG